MEAGKLSALREIAKSQGRRFQVVLEDAAGLYPEDRSTYKMHPDVKAAYDEVVRRFPKTLEMPSK
ncbi:hypothetical protein [uncultured Algimonas sp.]|uniref:hypothetical protein n=1 Tax=uncultured Algimonas sp. TaxID=1547920 RepID=UPI0026055DE1|nr:hypothetical protein [uncultured Algimonas sp.]